MVQMSPTRVIGSAGGSETSSAPEIADFNLLVLFEQESQFFVAETNGVDLEIEVFQRAKLGSQQLIVPSRVLRELVIRDDVGSFLKLAQMIEHDNRNVIELQFPCCQETPVTGDDSGMPIYQDRSVEPKRLNASRDLRDLSV